jgi:hypothetical protein
LDNCFLSLDALSLSFADQQGQYLAQYTTERLLPSPAQAESLVPPAAAIVAVRGRASFSSHTGKGNLFE